MHITLHITTSCNFNCDYCYSHPPKHGIDMTKEVIDKAIEFSARESDPNIGIIFFGGEPFLRKDLINYTIGRCKTIEKENEYRFHFHFKVTTNGSLLDRDFLRFSRDVGLNYGLSIDGIPQAHNTHRKLNNGQPSFELIDKNIDLLLKYKPYSNAFLVVSPETLKYYSKSVEYLINRGFKYIIPSLNFAGNWDDRDLKELEKQYEKIAKLYLKWTIEQKKFYYSPFEMKLATHIRGNDDDCYTCQLSKKQISIAPDGKIYPCVQFVKDGISNTHFSIGDIWNGFDERRETLFNKSIEEKDECSGCALRKRCYNTCSCLNWQTTGYINRVSALLCESERILIRVADKLGDELYIRRLPMFIQKQYNKVYPLLSMLEDDLMKH